MGRFKLVQNTSITEYPPVFNPNSTTLLCKSYPPWPRLRPGVAIEQQVSLRNLHFLHTFTSFFTIPFPSIVISNFVLQSTQSLVMSRMKYSSMSMSSIKYLLFISKFSSLSPSLNSSFFSDAVRRVLQVGVGEILEDAVSGVARRGGGGGVSR